MTNKSIEELAIDTECKMLGLLWITPEHLTSFASLNLLQDKYTKTILGKFLELQTLGGELSDFTMLTEEIDNRYLKERVRNVQTQHSTYAKLTSKDLTTKYHSLIKHLKHNRNRLTAVEQLTIAIDHLNEGNAAEAMKIAKSLNFQETKVEFPSTTEMMFDSVNQSNSFKTGVKSIDKLGGFQLGELAALGGDVGSMKTMWSVWLCLNILKENPNFKCAYFEKEMHSKVIANRLISYICAIDQGDIHQIELIQDTAKRLAAQEDLRKRVKVTLENDTEYADILRRFQIIPNTDFHTAYDIADIGTKLDIDIWGLDFLKLITDKSEQSADRDMEQQLGVLKDFTLTQETFGIVLSQLNQKTVETRSMKIPTRTDFEWGKQLKQLSSYMFATFNPRYYYTEDTLVNPDWYYIIGLKHRHGAMEDIPFVATPSICEFTEITEYIKHREAMQWLTKYKNT